MTTSPAKTITLKNISIASVERYLREKGWSQVPTSNPKALVYAGPKDIYGNNITVVLPASKTFIDAERRLSEAIRTIAIVQDISPSRVLYSIARLKSPSPPSKEPAQHAQ